MTAPEVPPGLDAAALAAATAESDPESLAASVRLRNRFGPDVAAAAVTQVVLRRRARAKFGAAAAEMFFTRDGLEQATRPEVAGYRAARLAATGVRRVVDLGCGIGTDAIALLRAGLEVVAVERDPAAAAVARANLAAAGVSRFDVLVGTAEELWPTLAGPGTAVFCDPARRTDRGRSWRLEDLSPGWPFVLGLLDGARPAVVKLGPGLAHRAVPDGVEAEWISSRGQAVELALWAGPTTTPGQWSAFVIDSGDRLITDPTIEPPPTAAPRGLLYEPLGAVLRSGGLPSLAAELDAAVLHPDVAYLTTEVRIETPYATGFTVEEWWPYRERALRDWCRQRDVGILEIKTRGLELDPAALRRRLKLRGAASATVVLARAAAGPTALVVHRFRHH